MALTATRPTKALSVFSLVMINVIAVASLRSLPFSAQFGTSLIFYYLLIAVLIFFPVALITAELATTWPKSGGIYLWVREAFGPKCGFLVIWLQWVYNLVWFPAILAVIATFCNYLLNPIGEANTTFVMFICLAVFWFATIGNLFGMQVSGWISSVCSIIGTIIPMIGIMCLGVWWIFVERNTPQISLTWGSIVPKVTNISDLALVSTLIFGLMGLEMSAVHVRDVQNPRHDYPVAIKYSTVIILAILLFGSLIIAAVVPAVELNLVTGVVQAFGYFCDAMHMAWILPTIVLAILIGSVGTLAAWIIGPSKGLLVAAQEDNLPKIFAKTNKKGVPVMILFLQGIIVSLLSTLFILMPTAESAYVILTQLTAILALLMYVLMFTAAIRLRYKHPNITRPYKIPGGNFGMWVVGLLGGGSSFIAMLLGFLPPSQIEIYDPQVYQLLLVFGVILFCSPAFFIHRQAKN